MNRIKENFPIVNVKEDLNLDIGGVWGVGASKCLTSIHLEKNEFYSGQKAPIRIVCDNSKCDKNIKSFKFKLYRMYTAVSSTDKDIQAEDYGLLADIKLNGISARSKCDKVFEIDLPKNDFSTLSPATKFEERAGASYSGKLMHVEFILQVFVRHDCWNEFGQGFMKSFPIRIHQAPLPVSYNSDYFVLGKKPSKWQP